MNLGITANDSVFGYKSLYFQNNYLCSLPKGKLKQKITNKQTGNGDIMNK
jgi:hypothetical protein